MFPSSKIWTRTPASSGGNSGSIPLGNAKFRAQYLIAALLLLAPLIGCAPAPDDPGPHFCSPCEHYTGVDYGDRTHPLLIYA